MDIVGNRTIRDMLCERAHRYGSDVAVVFEQKTGSVSEWTYGDLRRYVELVAAGLQRFGLEHGDRVVMQMGNTPAFVLTWLGVAWMGGIAVPANTANTLTEMAHVGRLSRPAAFVGSTDQIASFQQHGDILPTVRLWVQSDLGGEAADGDALNQHEPSLGRWLDAEPTAVSIDIKAEDVAELVFTSGTSALPKAVMLTHANYLHSGEREARVMMIERRDRLLTALPLFHVNAQSNTLLAAITAGATAVFLEEYSASRFWDQIRRHGATTTSLVAMIVRTLLAQPTSDLDRDHNVHRALYAINVSDAEKQAFESRFGVDLINGYGLSEAMTVVTAAPLHGDRRWPSIGLPAPGREVAVVLNDGEPAPPGSLGEIVVHGVPGRTLMKGYFDDSDATAEALRGSWLHTGDNGYLDDKGYLYFVDRSKDIIKRAGENISSSEVELTLVAHPGVREAAVIGVPDPIRDESVKAFVVLEAGHSLDASELQTHCAKTLSRFKVPTLIEFLTELPKTSIGKIQKGELRKRPTVEQ